MGYWSGKNRPKGNKAVNWKGGKINNCYYWYIHKPNHPFSNSMGYIAEHRLIMEKKIGRYLTKQEVVHHIDGNRKNNKLSNLKLFANDGEHMKIGHPKHCKKIGKINKGKHFHPITEFKKGHHSPRKGENRQTRRCFNCEKGFEIPQWRINQGRGKFCTHKCYLIYWRK